MNTTRFAGPVVVAVLTLAAACARSLNSAPQSDGAWNTARVKVVSQSPARLVIARGIAIRDASLRDGTIDVDIDAPTASQFAGLAFRVASTADYEMVYFRAEGGRWAEVQYQPVFEGEPTWQLYPGPGYTTGIPATITKPGAPMHVKLVFVGTRGDVYLNGSPEPVLRIVELKRALRAGGVAVWAGGGDSTPAAFANYAAVARVERQPAAMTMSPPQRGQLMQWIVSRRLASPDSIVAPAELSPALYAALQTAKVAVAEADGLMSLTKWVGNPAGPQPENIAGGAGWGLALAGATIEAKEAHTARLRFGYSEGIAVFLNGRRVFSGTHPYASPDLGRVSADANTVELPLMQGTNELVLAVTDKGFGWGFRARLDDDHEITTGRN